jgi:hypothetical protein
MRILFFGIVLLLVSAPPLLLTGREVAVGQAVQKRYSVERITSPEKDMEGGALRSVIGGHTVELADDQARKEREPLQAGETRVQGKVWVVVDGRTRSTPVPATIRLERRDANRYWGFAYLMKIGDPEEGDRLVVAQNLGDGQYRTISIFPDGQVVQDEFDYKARCSPPIRAELIRSVVPHPSGYCSDVTKAWPSLWYPVLYPWGSGGVGGLLTVVGMSGLVSRRRRRRERLDV